MTLTFTDNETQGPFDWNGGPMHVQAAGNFGGGALDVEYKLPGGSNFTSDWQFSDVSDTTRAFDLPAGTQVQYVLSGAAAPNLEVVQS